jgi:hypothetical protein
MTPLTIFSCQAFTYNILNFPSTTSFSSVLAVFTSVCICSVHVPGVTFLPIQMGTHNSLPRLISCLPVSTSTPLPPWRPSYGYITLCPCITPFNTPQHHPYALVLTYPRPEYHRLQACYYHMYCAQTLLYLLTAYLITGTRRITRYAAASYAPLLPVTVQAVITLRITGTLYRRQAGCGSGNRCGAAGGGSYWYAGRAAA